MSDASHAYYLGANGQQSGPFTEDQVRQMLASGAIHSTDLCWREGLSEWIPVSQAMAAASASFHSFQPVAQPAVYAGFWLRDVAFFIDWFVLLIPSYGISLVFSSGISPAMAASGYGGRPIVITCLLFNIVLGEVLDWLYYASMESSRFQATLGKLALSLRVTGESGGRIGFGRATGRHFGKIISAIILGIGFLMAGFTARKQALHDLMAGCLVIRK